MKHLALFIMLITACACATSVFAAETNASTDIAHWGTAVIQQDGTFLTDGDVTASGALSGASLSASSISNDTGLIYGSNLTVVTGGAVDFPDDSLEVADVAAGSLPADVIAQNLSNDTAQVYGSNLTVVAGGAVDFPDDSLEVADVAAGSLPADVIAQNLSNDTAQVYGSNLTVVAGGAVDFPDDSLDKADVDADLYEKDGVNMLTEGYFDVVDYSNLVFIATETNGVALAPYVTNSIDADISN